MPTKSQNVKKNAPYAALVDHLLNDPLGAPEGVAQLADNGVLAVHGDPLSDDALQRSVSYSWASRIDSKKWSLRKKSIAALTELLTNHVEGGDKSGNAIVMGTLHGSQRLKNAVTSLWGVAIDVDNGQSVAEGVEAAKKFGRFAILVTSHSHLNSTSVVAMASLDKFSKDEGLQTITDAEILHAACEYLRTKKHYVPSVLENATYGGAVSTDEGFKHAIHHNPIPKWRIFYPRAENFDVLAEMKARGLNQSDTLKLVEKQVLALAGSVGLQPDSTTGQPYRGFYAPKHKPGAPFEVHVIRGAYLTQADFDKLADGDVFESAGSALVGSDARGDDPYRFSPNGVELFEWNNRNGASFEPVEAVRAFCPEHIRRDGDNKISVVCPFDDFHSNAGDESDTACWVQNSSATPGDTYQWGCQHDHCRSQGFARFLGKALHEGWFPESVIEPGSPFLATIVENDESSPDAKGQEFRSSPDSKASPEKRRDERLPAILSSIDSFSGTTPDAEIDVIFAELVSLKVGKAQTGKITEKIAAKTGKKPDDLGARAKRAFIISKLKSGATVFENEAEGIEAMNAVAATVLAGSTFRVIFETPDDGEMPYRLLTAADAAHRFAPWQIVGGTENQPKLVPLFPIWKAAVDHRHYENIVFDPSGHVSNPKHYNLWTGLKVAPTDHSIYRRHCVMDWHLIARHLFAVICNGDADHFENLMAWQADMYQDPARKKGVALVLNSPERGTGKGTVAALHQRVLGRHAQKFTGADSLTNKFNAPLAEALLVIGEEVLFSGDHKAANVMKAAITEDTVMLERKGVDKIQVKSHARYMLLSNEERAAPAESASERRYFILRVGAQYAKTADPAQQEKSKAYFDALYHEIDNGGVEAFLAALMQFDTSRVDLRNPPKTKALADQIEANLRGEDKWLFDALASGAFVNEDGELIDDFDTWERGPVEVPRDVIFKSYNAAVSTYGQRRASHAEIGKFLTANFPNLDSIQKREKNGARPRYYVFPSLAECRAAFEQRSGVRFSPEMASAGDTASDRWEMLNKIDVNPSDDHWYETGRLMQIDAEIEMVLFPEALEESSDSDFSAWFYTNAPAGMGASALDRTFAS